jgi:hypothetical protein
MNTSDEIERNPGREARSFFSSLFLLVFLFSLMSLLTACTDGVEETTCGSTLATVRDYTGLDGCGLVLVKDNGEVLEPYKQAIVCVTTPCEPIDDLAAYNLQDGQRVRIGYEELKDAASICMTGIIVKIKCLEVVGRPAENGSGQ